MKRIALVTSLAFACSPAFSNLTEQQVVVAGLKNPQLKTQFTSQLNTAKGKKQSAGKWDNPTLTYSNETLDFSEGTAEESIFFVTQKINLSGAKGFERQAADLNYRSQQLDIENQKLEWRRVLRENFYNTLAAQQVHTAIVQLQNRLSKLSSIVTQRANKGDASRYDVLRINKELALALTQSTQAKSRWDNQQHQLFSWLNVEMQPLSGNILPNQQSIADEPKNHSSPQLEALSLAQESAQARAKAAGRYAWPEITLGIGRKELREPDMVADGNVLSLAIEIPVFNQYRGEKNQANSRANELRAKRIVLEKQLQIRYQTTLNDYKNYSTIAHEIRRLSLDKKSGLSQIAEASYAEGEITVMELLDAYQSDLAIQQNYIQSALAARLAFIQLQYFQGE